MYLIYLFLLAMQTYYLAALSIANMDKGGRVGLDIIELGDT
jgi:hypothetical protein